MLETLTGQHTPVSGLVECVLTVARERYNCVQLCMLSLSPHNLVNLQQADQPRTPVTAHVCCTSPQCDVSGRGKEDLPLLK